MSKPPREPKSPGGAANDEHIARLEKALKEALALNEANEERLADQRQRLKLLGMGREETMRALAEAREQLRQLSIERDELRQKLTRVDSVQTATIALPEEERDNSQSTAAQVPSLDELMTALGSIETRNAPDGILHQRVQGESESDDSEEMISPALVFPEEYAANAKPASGEEAAVTRVLVLLDAERPVKYPLFKEVMTIGRADVADIQISNGFLSRLHARIVTTADSVTIEDAESKNGIRVNAKVTPRQTLRHGDVIDLGRLRFRYIDTSAEDVD
jgi:hypothetical protein